MAAWQAVTGSNPALALSFHTESSVHFVDQIRPWVPAVCAEFDIIGTQLCWLRVTNVSRAFVFYAIGTLMRSIAALNHDFE